MHTQGGMLCPGCVCLACTREEMSGRPVRWSMPASRICSVSTSLATCTARQHDQVDWPGSCVRIPPLKPTGALHTNRLLPAGSAHLHYTPAPCSCNVDACPLTLPWLLSPLFLKRVPAKCRDLLARSVRVSGRPNTACGRDAMYASACQVSCDGQQDRRMAPMLVVGWLL
jgi:hypothetical protein